MGHETLFLSPVRSKTKMKKKNPKKIIDLRPKPAVKEAEINQEVEQVGDLHLSFSYVESWNILT
jgi:hypothetical protein